MHKPFLVEVISVSKQDINYSVKSQGTVIPKVVTKLSAQISGQIVSVSDSFIEGGMFRKGDVLVQIERADYETELSLAESELARAEAALLEERARGKVAAEDWKTINSVAPELGLRKPQLAKELASVKAAQAQLERATRNLERTTLRAPFDGLVKDKSADIGQFISKGNQLGLLYSTDIAEIRIPLSDDDLAYIDLPSANESRSTVILSSRVSGKEVSWLGSLARNEGVFDENSRMIYGVVEVLDPYLRREGATGAPLKFGRFLQADVVGNQGSGLVVVPREVLRLDGTLLVINTDNKLNIREVQIQRTDEKSVYISGGLNNGERIAVSAVPNPVEGMLVRIAEADADQEDSSNNKDEGQQHSLTTVVAGE